MYGEGELKVSQHGWGMYRTWRKIHLAVDKSTRKIESCAMASNSVDDAAIVATLLKQIEGNIKN